MGLLDRYFEQTKEARESGAGNFFVPGLFRIKVLGTELQESQGDDEAIWFRAHWEILDFKGCKYNSYSIENGDSVVTQKDSRRQFEPGQKVSTVLNYSKKSYRGAINTIWVHLLSSLEPFQELSLDQIQEGMSLEDVNQLIEKNLAEGNVFITEVINSGMHKNKTKSRQPGADFTKHIFWAHESRYQGQKWWLTETSSAPVEEDDV